MARPTVGIVGGGEASATAQPATGGRSMRHDRRYFGRLEQENQRLKKHDGRWMDIVRSLQLESFILTKLTKPFVRVNLVGPHVSLQSVPNSIQPEISSHIQINSKTKHTLI